MKYKQHTLPLIPYGSRTLAHSSLPSFISDHVYLITVFIIEWFIDLHVTQITT